MNHVMILSKLHSSIKGQRLLQKEKTRPYTRQHQSRAGGQGQYGSWAGAVTEISSPFSSKRPKTSDFGPTDRPTDRPTDIVIYRVACTRLINSFLFFFVQQL